MNSSELRDLSLEELEAIPEDPPRGARRLMKVRSGKDLPDSAYVAVRYSDHWFWIDRADNRSKNTFAYLSMLLTVTEGGSTGGAPLVLTVN